MKQRVKKRSGGKGPRSKGGAGQGARSGPAKPRRRRKRRAEEKGRVRGPAAKHSPNKRRSETPAKESAPKKAAVPEKPRQDDRKRRDRKSEPAVVAQPRSKKPVEPEVATDGKFHSGYVALVGRPNVGKSTILNELLGQKIAATTSKPQTTRKNILGMLHPKGAQLLLLDTPGHHQAKGKLNRFMVGQSERAIADADVIGWVVEARADAQITPGNTRLLKAIQRSKKPVVLLVNKIDLIKNKEGMLHQIQAYSEALGPRLCAAVPISAAKRRGLEVAVRELARALPEGPPLYEHGQITDQPERAIVAEFIREKAMIVTEEELPYATAVTIEDFDESREDLARISAVIHVERESQKGILIGKHGERLKEIGTRARKDIEYLLGRKVFLELNVRVAKAWSSDARALARLGYTERDPNVDLGEQWE